MYIDRERDREVGGRERSEEAIRLFQNLEVNPGGLGLEC